MQHGPERSTLHTSMQADLPHGYSAYHRMCREGSALRVAGLRVQHGPGCLLGARLRACARQLAIRHVHVKHADACTALGRLPAAHGHAPLRQRGHAAKTEAGVCARNVLAMQQRPLTEVQHLSAECTNKDYTMLSLSGNGEWHTYTFKAKLYRQHSLSWRRALMLGLELQCWTPT